MRERLWCLALAGVLAGCGASTPDLPPNAPIQQDVKLTRFTDDQCDGLRRYIADTAVLQMKSTLEMEKKQGPVIFEPEGVPVPATATPTSAGPSSYTTTNTQVAGVGEADFVKNDGTRIFVLSGQTLYSVASWPPKDLSLASSLSIEGWPREMLLDGNTLAIFSDVYVQRNGPPPMQPMSSGAMTPIACPATGPDCAYAWGNVTKLTEVDVTDATHPKVVQQLYLPGRYDTSRRIEDSARVVLSGDLSWPDGLSYWPSGSFDPKDHAAWVAAIDALEAKNEALIRAWPLSGWLPDGKRVLADGSTLDVSYQCSDFSVTNAPTRLGILTVATIDLANPEAPPTRSSTVARVGTVYASADALWVASSHWWYWPQSGETEWTYLYQFDLTHPDRANLLAAGGMEGAVVSSFALDEKDGYLRAAVNLGTLKVSDDNPWGTWTPSNRLEVLQRQGSRLVQVSASTDIAPGERLSSARFLGNEAFVSTFQYTDPFFTFDLTDPLHPRAVGKLEVPGETSYLQALDASHVLALGVDFPSSTSSGGNTGTVSTRSSEPLLLTLFDVSNLAQPKVVSQLTVGTGWASSQALWDHHAFDWYPEKHLLAIPFTDWNPDATDYWSNFVSDLRVFSVDASSGITPKGALSMADVYETIGDSVWSGFWSPNISRSVMATDQTGTVTSVYAISSAGVRVANLDALGTPLATVPFTPPPMLDPDGAP